MSDNAETHNDGVETSATLEVRRVNPESIEVDIVGGTVSYQQSRQPVQFNSNGDFTSYQFKCTPIRLNDFFGMKVLALKMQQIRMIIRSTLTSNQKMDGIAPIMGNSLAEACRNDPSNKHLSIKDIVHYGLESAKIRELSKNIAEVMVKRKAELDKLEGELKEEHNQATQEMSDSKEESTPSKAPDMRV